MSLSVLMMRNMTGNAHTTRSYIKFVQSIRNPLILEIPGERPTPSESSVPI
ncbi:MAG: hypothetical protein ACYCSO_09875 [Cuniculiplasma sp.]